VTYVFRDAEGVYALHDPAAEPRLVVPLHSFGAYHWSPGRDRIAFVSDNRSSVLLMLYVVDLASSTLQLVSPSDPDYFPPDFGLRAASPVAWSPDGEYIAFVAYDTSNRAALFVSEVASGRVTRLTEGNEPVTSVGWEIAENDQGDEVQRIVYALLRAGETRLYTVEPNGANN
jgi:Tol biopolymer transport system component